MADKPLRHFRGIRVSQSSLVSLSRKHNDGDDLKKAIVDKLQNENNLTYNSSEVIVGTGGKQCIFNLCLAILDHGDEVIIPAPYWVSYTDIAELTGAKSVVIPCGIAQEFKVLPSQLEDAITENTKLVMLNSPSNPTGSVYSKDELKKLTNDAFDKEVFGAPTFIVNNKIFWGQDRLDYAIEELS